MKGFKLDRIVKRSMVLALFYVVAIQSRVVLMSIKINRDN
jgi:hypothetical protein